VNYFVYLAECSDGTYYCGYTNDLGNRLREHNEGRYAAKYTRSRRPVRLVYKESFKTRSEALKREYEIKKMRRKQKESLINQNL
jgi:putative endonuclease